MTAKATINVSTECYDEIATAMKAAGLETTPDQLTIKRDTSITQPIDFRLATIRRDCLVEAVKLCLSDSSDFEIIAKRMFDFVIGKEKEGWK